MQFLTSRTISLAALLVLACIRPASSQTWTACNPLTQGSCPADPALAKTVNIDFTKGASDSFAASGAPTYGSNGAAFSVGRSGDSPTITSRWYIMFGRVDFVLKAAPGRGIVSSAILQSDCLDEIDFEWLGGDNSQVQSNYFGKGQTTTGYNRGAFHGAMNNHDQFRTYTIDWTSNQIVWYIDGQVVRVLTPSTAEAGQYPQTPMQIKVGIWAGGDPSNSPGTVQWAGGPTDYTSGPYAMYLKSIRVQDYSTGSSYSYSGTTGTWDSIRSNGGTINPKGGASNPSVASQPPVSTASGAPRPFSTSPEQSSIYATRTGFPWVLGTPSVTTSRSAVATSYSGLPSGWIIDDSGKVHPPNAGSTDYPSTFSSSVSALDWQSVSGVEVTTTYDAQGSSEPATSTVAASQTISSESTTINPPTLTTSTSLRTDYPTRPDTSLSTQPTRQPPAVAASDAALGKGNCVSLLALWSILSFTIVCLA